MCELYFSQDPSQEWQVHDTWCTSPPFPCSWKTSPINQSILSWSPNVTTESFLNLASHRVSYYLDICVCMMKFFCHSWSKWIKQKNGPKKKPFSFSFLYEKMQLRKKRSFENLQNSIYSFRDKRTGGNLTATFHSIMREWWVLKNQAMAVLLLETEA